MRNFCIHASTILRYYYADGVEKTREYEVEEKQNAGKKTLAAIEQSTFTVTLKSDAHLPP